MDPILRFESVTKSFQGQCVLESLNLEVRSGEFLTLLGPSGCGKTTCLNLTAGFLKPDSGTITLRGQVVNDLPPRKRNLSMVFQTWALFPHMTAYDNVAFGLVVRKRPKSVIEPTVFQMLDLVRLRSSANKYPSQLSGGMRQRLALARALAVEPGILLLDEPLSALDAALRKEMQVEIKRIQEKLRVTTIFVTHNQEEALTMSDRIGVMRGGKIVRIDTPHELYTDPQSRFVCTFMGDVNIFEGRVEGIEGPSAVMRSGPHLVRFPPRNGLKVGAEVCVAIRPERVTLEKKLPPGIDNYIPAVVRDLVYSGSSIQYWLESDGREFTAFEYRKPRGEALPQPGEAVNLCFQPEDLMLLDRD
jgi:spermidine/putrescine transport system ATP-binding protein